MEKDPSSLAITRVNQKSALSFHKYSTNYSEEVPAWPATAVMALV
jgi:hypothetical protein